MNNKPNLQKRTSRPQSLGGAFGGLLRIFGARASDADLAARWDEIVGADLAAKGRLVGTRCRRVHNQIGHAGSASLPKQFDIKIRPKVKAMAMELSYRAPEFQEKINKYFGYDAVSRIIISH
jgi:hypothetical protein